MKSDIEIEHSKMVAKLVKSPIEIKHYINYAKCDLLHATLGISGEVGEIIDTIKKHIIYNKPLDIENIKEELGDLEFYMEQLRQQVGLIREQTLVANMHKLSERYKDYQYSDQQAQDRNDKKEPKYRED